MNGAQTIKVIDFKAITRPEGYTSTVLPPPETIWEQIDKTTTKCQVFCFGYLFNCIQKAPKHHLRPASLQLMRAFFDGTLGTHIARFTILMDKWVVNITETISAGPGQTGFAGCVTTSRLYQHLILDYFIEKRIVVNSYLNTRLTNINASHQLTEETFDIILKTYKMHLFTVGELTDTEAEQVSDKIFSCFLSEDRTKETILAQSWPNYAAHI